MSKLLRGVLTALVLCILGNCRMAQAQTLYGNINQPPVSPYLNITRGGAPAGINYYGIVQPQLQFNSAINQLQAQQQQGGVGPLQVDGTSTGHPIQFNNYSHFFPQRGTPIAGLGTTARPVSPTSTSQYGNPLNTMKTLGSAPTAFPKLPR